MSAERFIELEQLCQGEDAWSPELVRSGLDSAAWLLDEQGRGYAVVSVAGDVADLQRIGVDPASRREGVASSLLCRALGVGIEGGASRMLLEVSDRNDGAAAFYAVHGFEEIDRRPRYYKDGSAAVVMQLALNGGGA